MAKATTPTLLSLDQWAEEMQFDPLLFNQVITKQVPEKRGTHSLWFQHGWQQSGKASRQQVADAIAKAEDLMSMHTGFWLAPKYVADERQMYPHPRIAPEMNRPRHRKTVNLKHTRFIEGGRRFVSLIEAGVDISGSSIDRDGDDFNEIMRFTVTHADAASWLPAEIAVYPAGTTDTAIEESIRNLKVWISGTTITIEGQSVWFVEPALWDNRNPYIDGNDPASFLANVDVYRVYSRSDTNDYAPIVFGWQDSALAPLAFGEQYGLLQPWLPEKGIASLVPAKWDDSDSEWNLLQSWTRIPQLVRLYYLSGWPADKFGRMSSPFARTVAAFATALLRGPVSGGGESINKIFSYWQEIPQDDSMTFKQANNPFGPQRGAWEAWSTVSSFYASLEGITV